MTSPETERLASLPLCVDLDGTLVLTDTLHEQLLCVLNKRPGALFRILVALFHGRAEMKRAASESVELDYATLPYDNAVLEILRSAASDGRRVVLVTAADSRIANGVAAHLGIFSDVLSSNGTVNLKGPAKVSAIKEHLRGRPFEYYGDSHADVPVWREAASAGLVGVTSGLRRKVGRLGTPVRQEITRRTADFKTYLRAIRAYQWSKNLLVFAPLFLSHQLFVWPLFVKALIGFAAMSATASACYVFNDLIDLPSDRVHRRKRTRPFASGLVTPRQGVVLMIALLSIASAICFLLPPVAAGWIGLYAIGALLYSIGLKKMVLIDVVSLSGLYIIRIMLGGAVTGVVVSQWTLAFSFFLFVSLATCKRLSELRRAAVETGNTGALPGRAYHRLDLPQMASLGAASSFVTVLVLALYTTSPEVVVLYRRPQILWLLCPILVYWLSRMLVIANRGEMHDDPIIFALLDKASQASLCGALIAIAAAMV